MLAHLKRHTIPDPRVKKNKKIKRLTIPGPQLLPAPRNPEHCPRFGGLPKCPSWQHQHDNNNADVMMMTVLTVKVKMWSIITVTMKVSILWASWPWWLWRWWWWWWWWRRCWPMPILPIAIVANSAGVSSPTSHLKRDNSKFHFQFLWRFSPFLEIFASICHGLVS